MPKDERTIKTLAIRLDDQLHMQVSMIAMFEETTITDIIRKAIEVYVENKRGEGSFADRAEKLLQEIEAEADSRKSAIRLFTDLDAHSTERPRRTRRGTEGDAQGN